MPSVSAAVFRGSEMLWEQALGHADVDAARVATPQTQYRIGSITKTFTAVGIMQLRDAGELSLDDPLTAHLPESAHGPTIGRMLAHFSGLQREPPGEIWETMKAPSREDLLAGTAEAEQVLDPGTWWHYSNLAFALLGEVVARAARRHLGGGAPGADPRAAGPVAHDAGRVRAGRARLLRRALLGRRPARARARSRRRGCARQALVDDRRPGAVGRVPRLGRRPRAEGVDTRRDVARARDGRPRRLDGGVGDGARALPPRREPVRRSRRRDARASRGTRRRPQDEDRRRGADEHRGGRVAREACARPRDGRHRCPAGGRRTLAGGRAGARGNRAAARGLVDGGAPDGRWRGGRAGSRRSSSAACPAATPRSSSPMARTASEASRAVSAASCCASSAVRPARSRSSTSRPIR